MAREQEIIQEFVSRTDEIIKESIKKHPRFAERRVGFIDGAEWADRTMIEKAVKWLEENCTVEGQCIIKLDMFKKAMLE